jgi:hypothetical protein
LRGFVLAERGVHAPAGVVDVDRLSKVGDASFLQVLGDLGKIRGEVEGRTQIYDGGVQDVPL